MSNFAAMTVTTHEILSATHAILAFVMSVSIKPRGGGELEDHQGGNPLYT